jgi:thiaminase (transcriptional activator TenA)
VFPIPCSLPRQINSETKPDFYSFLGQQLAANGITDHQYADWILTYSNGEFEALTQQLESLVEKYAAGNTSLYQTYAMFCELEFFEAVWAK